MSEWRNLILEDIAKYVTNKTSFESLEINDYVSTINMLPDKQGICEIKELPNASSVNVYKKNDILISNIRPYFKKIWYADRDGTNSGDVLVFRVKKTNEVDSKYLYYCLHDDKFFAHMMAGAKGTKMPRGDKSAIMKYEINLPPLPTQRRIAAILSSLDDKIENNRKTAEKLEETAQAIFKRWFVDFEFPNEDGKPYKYSGGEMVYCEELGKDVPKGWEASTLEDVSTYLSRGIAPKYTEEKLINVINQKCIRNSMINLNLCRYHKGKCNEEKLLQFGDVLVNSTGQGTLGRVAQFYLDIPDITVDSHVTIIRPNNSVGIEYFGYLLSNMEKDFEYAGSGSTGQTELGRKVIGSMPIALPNKRVEIMFSNIASKIKKTKIKLDIQNRNLINTRDALLPKLMSGEIEV